MNAADLLALAKQCEKAREDRQHALILEAFYTINGPAMQADAMEPKPQRAWIASEGRLLRMLRVEAYESAAMMLVPEGAFIELAGPSSTQSWSTWPSQWRCECSRFPTASFGATPALALTAASLRAHAAIASKAEGR